MTALAFDSQGNALAGTEPNGILYRISARDKAFVLYDANLPEIRSIVPMPDGTIYAAALGGSVARSSMPQNAGVSAPISVTVTAPPTSITVSDTDTQAGPDIKPRADASRPTAPAGQAVAQAASTLVEIPGVDKSALYKINPDSTVETLWTSKDENVYSMVVEPDGGIVFATDAQGRVYRLQKDRQATLLVETEEGEATRLIAAPGGLLAATGDMGKLFRLSGSEGTRGNLRIAGARCGDGGALGPHELAWSSGEGGLLHAFGKFVASGQNLDRLGTARRSAELADSQSQCALHSMARRAGWARCKRGER